MWPFEAKRRRSLAGLSRAAPVDLTGTIVSGNDVRSPFSELCAALVWIELTETMSVTAHEAKRLVATGVDLAHFDGDRLLGSVVLGDTLVLRTDDAIDVSLCPRRARVVFATGDTSQRAGSIDRFTTSAPDLKSLMRKAAGGQVTYRELGMFRGRRGRLRAVVEPIAHVTGTAYRDTAKPSFAVRDEEGPFTLEALPSARPAAR